MRGKFKSGDQGTLLTLLSRKTRRKVNYWVFIRFKSFNQQKGNRSQRGLMCQDLSGSDNTHWMV